MYGLLGRKLSHSLSPQIHAHFGKYSYELFCREPEELDEIFQDKTLKAYNVTIPYKIEAFNRCDELSETAKAFFDFATSEVADDLIVKAGAVPVAR